MPTLSLTCWLIWCAVSVDGALTCLVQFLLWIHFKNRYLLWKVEWHMTLTPQCKNYWSSGEPPLPHYACIYRPSEISSFTVISISNQMMEVVENVFTLTICVLTQTAEFFCWSTCLINPHLYSLIIECDYIKHLIPANLPMNVMKKLIHKLM